MGGLPDVSVVIPALNEAEHVASAVASVIDHAREVIVADGGSRDDTSAVAARAGARLVAAPRGRARQMQAGALQARGRDWLVFLHADTRLGRGWADDLSHLGGDVVAGAFRLRLDGTGWRCRLVEAGVRLRCHAFALPYGDQGLFVRPRAFARCGGFVDVPILEDVDLVRRVRSCGRLAFPPSVAVTSARRWEQNGFLRTTLTNWLVMTLSAAGVGRDRLAHIYGSPGR